MYLCCQKMGFLDSYNIHSISATSYIDAIRYLCENKECDIVSYNNTVDNFFLIGDVHINNNIYYYDYKLNKLGATDVFSDINVSCESKDIYKLEYLINGILYSSSHIDNEILVFLAPYSDIRLRISFLEKPDVNDIIEIQGICYVLRNKLRAEWIYKSGDRVYTGDNNYYYSGIMMNVRDDNM